MEKTNGMDTQKETGVWFIYTPKGERMPYNLQNVAKALSNGGP